MRLSAFLKAHKWAIFLCAVALFLFYWFELRPIWIYRSCTRQASVDARKLLASKAQIAKGTEQGAAYEQLIQKNMYLRSDYESFLTKCFLYYGEQVPSALRTSEKSSSSNPS